MLSKIALAESMLSVTPPFLKLSKKPGPTWTNHEDEEDQAEVLHESENFLWAGEANVASQNTCEENEGDT